MPEEDEPVVVYAGGSMDAGFVKSLLEEHGIPAFLMGEMMGRSFPWYVAPGGVGAVKVVVAGRDADKARQIVQKFLDSKST